MIWYFQGHCLMGAFWFAVLLNLKHIFMYVAPAYFIYLLRSYCFLGTHSGSSVRWQTFSLTRFAKLGLVVTSVFVVSFGPFVFLNQLHQVINNALHVLLAQESLAIHMACIPEKCHGWFCGKLGVVWNCSC
jgi:NADH:ubiquinone oxidoreductase subunit 4 (subunit M)